jgi:hypothetical protein
MQLQLSIQMPHPRGLPALRPMLRAHLHLMPAPIETRKRRAQLEPQARELQARRPWVVPTTRRKRSVQSAVTRACVCQPTAWTATAVKRQAAERARHAG